MQQSANRTGIVASAVSTAPNVSFIVPVRNDARRLERCLATISANRYPSDRLEIIVVDNGSVDDSAEVARRAGARVLELPGLPVSRLRNLGARAASGEILAFVDADHEIVPDWVACAVGALAEPGVGVAGALCEAPSNGTWVQRAYALLRHRRPGVREVEWLGSGNMIVWRHAFDAIGGFDTGLETCEDVDLCRRIRSAGFRVLQDSRLRNVHLGDPSSLRELFRGELWRGRDNLRASLRGPLTARELPSIVMPLADLVFLVIAILGLTSGGTSWLVLTGIGLGGIASASAARALRMVSHESPVTLVRLVQAFAVATVYDLARALAVVRPGRHEARHLVRR